MYGLANFKLISTIPSLYDLTRIYMYTESAQQNSNCPCMDADLHKPFMMAV